MHRYVKSVSASSSGDYYQLTLDDGDTWEEQMPQSEQFGPYVLLQRQFEMANDGECYVESEDEAYIGHFRLALIEFSAHRLAFEIDRVKDRYIKVDFVLSAAQFEEVLPIVEVIFGLREPECDDDEL